MNGAEMNNSTVNFTSEEFRNHNYTEITCWVVFVHSFNIVICFPTNVYVIWLIVTAPGGVASEIFNLNLSVCDIGLCLASLSSFVLNYYQYSLHLGRFTWFLEGLLITGKPLFQCLMCVERYLAVVHPVTFLKYKPLRYRLVCCSVAWIIILGFCGICMYIIEQPNSNIYTYFYSLQFFFIFIIQMFCLVAVLRALKQSGPGERRKEEENNMKRKAFYLILITTVTMSIIYVPPIIAGFIFMFSNQVFSDVFSFGVLCFILAGYVQPVFYLHRSGKISSHCILKKDPLN